MAASVGLPSPRMTVLASWTISRMFRVEGVRSDTHDGAFAVFGSESADRCGRVGRIAAWGGRSWDGETAGVEGGDDMVGAG